MTDSEAFTIILKWMMKEVSNAQYKEKLGIILKGVENQKHIEETRQPRYQSIVLFGTNLFPFSPKQYGEMAEELIKGL